MTDDVSIVLDELRDSAQQIVTCLLHGDRGLASDIAKAVNGPVVLVLVLADLVAYTHHRWALATGVPRDQAWAELLLDIEEWRVAP